MLLIITSTGDGFLDLSMSITLNDLEPPKGIFGEFFALFDAAHIPTLNCDEMAENRLRQPAYEIFSIKRIF